MATEQIVHNLSVPTASDMSANQYKAVNINASGNCVLATAAKNCDGIQQNAPIANDTASIGIFGVSKVLLGGTVVAGALLEIGTAGVFVTIASGTAVAKALEGGAINNYISALILKSNSSYA